MAATVGLNFRTQIFWDGSMQPNILQNMARAHSLAARRLAQGVQKKTRGAGRSVHIEVDGVCGQVGDNRS